jgi:hypothetical protein
MARKSFLLFFVFIAAFMLASAARTAQAQDAPHAWTSIETNLRTGPGRNFDVITTLPVKVPLIIEGRDNPRTWVLIHTQDGKFRGWIIVKLLRFENGVNVANFPVSGETLNAPAVPIPADGGSGGDGGTFPTGDLNAPFIPKISAGVRASMRVIAAKGRALGNNPRVFSKVGDCMTDHWAFLSQIGWGRYNLNQYGYLQEVIGYFMVSPREGVGSPWDVDSLAAHNGFNSAAVLDPAFADPNICLKDESPLECEYRLNKPSVAIIMFGTADVIVMTPGQFNKYLRDVVKRTMDRGIVPILNTFPENPSLAEKSRQFNQIIVKIANEKRIPLINLAGALKPLPMQGVQENGIHLTIPADESQSTNFDANNLQYGYTVRNLLTLEALNAVWKSILR